MNACGLYTANAYRNDALIVNISFPKSPSAAFSEMEISIPLLNTWLAAKDPPKAPTTTSIVVPTAPPI